MPKNTPLYEQLEDVLEILKSKSSFRTVDRADDADYYAFDLTTNDYFALSDYTEEELINIITEDGDEDLQDALELYLNREEPYGGSTGSRLVSGNNEYVRSLEQIMGARMSASQGKDVECLLFNSGYHANVGILPALAKLNPSTIVLMDQLIHASCIDGVRLAGCSFKRFLHNDLDSLEEKLSKAVEKYENVIICVESIYSMDGDGLSSLRSLALLKAKYAEQANIILYCDEAHACGLFGDNGFGRVEDENALKQFDIVVCPLGKAFNAFGCLVFADPLLKQYIVNTCRSFIYSTALPPVVIEYIYLVFLAINTKFFKSQAQDLLSNSEVLRDNIKAFIQDQGYSEYIANHLVLGEYQITGLILGSNKAVLAAKDFFTEEEIKVSAIRYPTVPQGQERIRISLQADYDAEDIREIIDSFEKFLLSPVAQEAIAAYVEREFGDSDYDEDDYLDDETDETEDNQDN